MLTFNNNNNLCYLNSLLQLFLNNEKLINYIIENKYLEYIKNKNICGLFLLNIVNDKIEGNNASNKNINFFNACLNSKNILRGEHQCANEILHKIIIKLNIENIFNINLITETNCLDCKHTVNKIEKELGYHYKKNLNEVNFLILDDYKCDKCKNENIINIETIDIPLENKFLLIYFTAEYDKENNSINKKKKIINKIITLKNIKYLLKTKILHFGDMNKGHYISIYYKNNKIYKINDNNIDIISEKEDNSDFFNMNTSTLLYNRL